MITLRRFLRMCHIAQKIRFEKEDDWRMCHCSEAEGFLPQEWLDSFVISFQSDWDEFYIDLV